MASQDFTLSYTISELLTWIEHSEGQIGPASTIFADIVSLENIGPASTIFADITSLENIGAVSNTSTSAIAAAPSTILADIIHYSQDGSVETNILELQDDTIVRANFPVRNWRKQSNRIEVIVCETNLSLAPNNSNALITNGISGSGLSYNLPANPVEGLIYTVVNTSSSGTITVSSPTDKILGGLSGLALMNEANLDSLGSKVRLQFNGVNDWIILNSENITTQFNPGVINGIALWLDASTSGTITTVSSNVSEWRDRSSNGRDFAQTNASDRPAFITSAINGLPGVEFANGTTEFLELNSNLLTGSVGEVFAVYLLDSLTAAQTIFAQTNRSSGSIRPLHLIRGRDDSTDFAAMFHTTDAGANSDYRATTTTLSISTPYYGSWRSDSSTYTMRINGITQADTGTGTDGLWFGEPSNSNSMQVGALNSFGFGVGQPLKGKLGELIIYDGVELTVQQRTDIETYLSNKWGI